MLHLKIRPNDEFANSPDIVLYADEDFDYKFPVGKDYIYQPWERYEDCHIVKHHIDHTLCAYDYFHNGDGENHMGYGGKDFAIFEEGEVRVYSGPWSGGSNITNVRTPYRMAEVLIKTPTQSWAVNIDIRNLLEFELPDPWEWYTEVKPPDPYWGYPYYVYKVARVGNWDKMMVGTKGFKGIRMEPYEELLEDTNYDKKGPTYDEDYSTR